MAAIVQVFTGAKQLQLGREQFIRRMSIGSNWNKARVAIRYSIQAVGSFYWGWGMGFTSNSKQYYDTTADMVYGTFSGGFAPPYTVQMNYNASYLDGNFMNTWGSHKVNNTVTNGSTGGNSNGMRFSASNAVRAMAMVEVTRTAATTFTVTCYCSANNAAPTDKSQADFFASLETESSPPNAVATVNSSLTGYNGAGLFDSVWIGWGTYIPVLNIHDIGVVRFS